MHDEIACYEIWVRMPGVRVYHFFLDGIIDAVERGNEISGDLAKQCFIDVQQQLGGIFLLFPAAG